MAVSASDGIQEDQTRELRTTESGGVPHLHCLTMPNMIRALICQGKVSVGSENELIAHMRSIFGKMIVSSTKFLNRKIASWQPDGMTGG